MLDADFLTWRINVSINETQTEDLFQPETPKQSDVWQTPELLFIKVNVDTEVLCDASHPCT